MISLSYIKYLFYYNLKFKASTVNRFVIRPNQGCLKAGQSLDVQIVFHKDVLICAIKNRMFLIIKIKKFK